MNQALGEAVVILSEFAAILLPAILFTGVLIGFIAAMVFVGEWVYDKWREWRG